MNKSPLPGKKKLWAEKALVRQVSQKTVPTTEMREEIGVARRGRRNEKEERQGEEDVYGRMGPG